MNLQYFDSTQILYATTFHSHSKELKTNLKLLSKTLRII